MASLKHRIAFAAAGVVTAAQAATIGLVLYVAEGDAEARAMERLAIGSRVVADYMETHKAQLELTVNVLASDFAFRSAVASFDLPTVTSALRNHANRIAANQAILVGVDGFTIASAPRHVELSREVWKDVVDSRTTLATLGDTASLHQVVVTPVRAPDVIGWVVMGFRIDDALAVQLRNLTGMEVSFVSRRADETYASSLMPSANGLHDRSTSFFTRVDQLTNDGVMPQLLLQLSRDDALAGYYALSRSMMVLGALAVCFAVAIAAFSSNRITRHLKSLADAARRISAGDYGSPVAIRSNDEVETLADALSTMQAGIAERERQIRRQATHDALTGLPNHEQAVTILDARMRDGGAPFAAIVLHIHGLHEINSSLGLEVGDAVIGSVARRLAHEVRAENHIARIADNRFLVVSEERDPGAIEALGARLRDEFEVLSVGGDIQVGLSLQIGVAEFPAHARDAATLVRKAWGASLEASTTKGGMAFFNVDRDAQHKRRLTIMRDIKAAVLDDQLSLVYQPKYDVRTDRIGGVEALLRWHHPTLGAVPVTEFIEVAEQTRNIGRLTRWVLRRALAQASGWRQRGMQLTVAVNVSAHDLTDVDFPQYVRTVLAEHGLSGQTLELEVTEGALVYDLPRVRRTLEALHALGVRIFIDDFGTGFSSLAQLRDLSVHALKIDRSFVMRLDEGNTHIVRSTIDLGHALDLEVVAEGVEDEIAVNKLISWGCDHLQGYYFAKPLAPDELEAYLARSMATVSHLPVRRS